MPAIWDGAEALDCRGAEGLGVLVTGSEDSIAAGSSFEDDGGIIILGSTAVTMVDVAAPPMEKNIRASSRSG